MIKFKRIILPILILVLINLALAQECITEIPEIIEQDTTLCNQEYNIAYTIQISSNVKLDCNKASLIGEKTNTAFLLQDTENSQIINCNLANFESGFYLDNANNNLITNNKVLDSKINSFYIKNSNNNQIYKNNINTELSYDELSSNKFCVDDQQNTYLDIIGPGCSKPEDIDNALIGPKLDEVMTKIAQATGINKQQLYDDYKGTFGKVDIKKTVQDNKIDIEINFDKEMSFKVYEYIPKETLESTDLIQTDAIILEKDPLMMWEFTDVKTAQLSYTLPSGIVEQPKTIVIETLSTEIDETEVRKVYTHEEDEQDEQDTQEQITENIDQEQLQDTPSEEPKKSNALLTTIVLVILFTIIVYLIKKKW